VFPYPSPRLVVDVVGHDLEAVAAIELRVGAA